MAIPNRQIGWSTKSNLLWQISKQLERLTSIVGGPAQAVATPVVTHTTTTTTTTV